MLMLVNASEKTSAYALYIWVVSLSCLTTHCFVHALAVRIVFGNEVCFIFVSLRDGFGFCEKSWRVLWGAFFKDLKDTV